MTEYFCGVYKRIYFFSNSSKEEILYLYTFLKIFHDYDLF